MKRQILIGLLSPMIFCVGSVSAQKTEKEKPNFSGIWNINFSKSKFNSLTLMSKNDTDSKSGKKSRSFINDYKISEDGKTLTRRFGDASTFVSPATRADFIFESKGIGEGNLKVGSQITVFNLEQ